MFLFDDLQEIEWSPRADIYRTPTGWLVKLDLAGVRPSDVTVEASDRRIRVTGVRKDHFVSRGFRHHSMEISYSRFERTISLPFRADRASIQTEYSDGMLIVTFDMAGPEDQ